MSESTKPRRTRKRIGGDLTNAEFAEKDEAFLVACEKASLPPTRRQASKYRRREGRAWAAGRSL